MTRVISLIMLALLAACNPGPQLARLQEGVEVLAFGDSLTLGTGVTPERAYPAILGQLSGLTVINAGIAGEETAEGLQRLPGLLQRHQPQLVIVMHGGNDLLRRRDKSVTKANLAAIIERIQAAGGEVLLVAVPEPGLMLRPAEYYAELAEEYQLPLERDVLARLLGDPALKTDQVHFNAEGYRMLGEAIWRKLKDSGAL